MKDPEFDFHKFVDEAIGQIIVSLGRDEFKLTIRSYFSSLYSEAHKIGFAKGVAETKAAMKKKGKKMTYFRQVKIARRYTEEAFQSANRALLHLKSAETTADAPKDQSFDLIAMKCSILDACKLLAAAEEEIRNYLGRENAK